MKGIISRQIPHTCSPSPKQGGFDLISRLTGLCYLITFQTYFRSFSNQPLFPAQTHTKTTTKNAPLKCQSIRGEFKKEILYSNLSLLLCVIWYQTSLGSQPPKIIVYSTLSTAIFPKKMRAALFLRKKPWGRGCCEELFSANMIPTSLFLFWPQNDDYRNFEAQTNDSGQVPLESKWEGPLWYPGYKCREKKNLNSKTTVTNR